MEYYLLQLFCYHLHDSIFVLNIWELARPSLSFLKHDVIVGKLCQIYVIDPSFPVAN